MSKKILSTFALLDVLSKGEKTKLLKRIERGEKINIVLRGQITGVFGNFDGTSREYSVDVESVEEVSA
jgi:hypothetical protein